MTDVATTTQREPASGGWRRMTRAVARRWPTGVAIMTTAASLALWTPLPHRAQTYVGAWCMLLAAVIYLTWGTAGGDLARRPLLRAQTAGVLGFGAVAIAAVAATPSAGRFVLAAGWLGHAVWDALHHRADCVVPRWYAETCLVIDLLIAAAVLAVG